MPLPRCGNWVGSGLSGSGLIRSGHNWIDLYAPDPDPTRLSLFSFFFQKESSGIIKRVRTRNPTPTSTLSYMGQRNPTH